MNLYNNFKQCCLAVFLFPTGALTCIAQVARTKPVIDSLAIVGWPSLSRSNRKISADGRFVAYRIDNQPVGARTLVLKSVRSNWQRSYIDARELEFSGDGKCATFLVRDSLHLIRLGQIEEDEVIRVKNYKLPQTEELRWLAFQPNSQDGELILRDLYAGASQTYYHVQHYWFDHQGAVLLLEIVEAGQQQLEWVNTVNKQKQVVWIATSPQIIAKIDFDKESTQLVFTTTSASNNFNTIWYYRMGEQTAIEKVTNRTTGIDSNMYVGVDAQFSAGGQYILFRQVPIPERRKSKLDAVQVDIYSYRDSIVQGEQLHRKNELSKGFLSVIGAKGKHAIRLQRNNEKVLNNGVVFVDAPVILSDKNDGGGIIGAGNWWPAYGQGKVWQVSLKDGGRKEIMIENDEFTMSPDGRYLVYAGKKHAGWFSYNLLTGESRSISKNIPPDWLSDEYGKLFGTPGLKRIAGWLSDASTVLVYGQYDIWQLDLSGIKPPISLTNGYGRRHQIVFQFLSYYPYDKPLTPGSEEIIGGFKPENKNSGYFKICIGAKNTDPEPLIFGPYNYLSNGFSYNGSSFDADLESLLKAAHAKAWIVSRETASVSSNLFYTSDFKQFDQLTNLFPEQAYNWTTSELINYPQLDGTMNQAVLYKPQDFDPTKKYPVILFQYELESYKLNIFQKPEFTSAEINIPWFVSRGYLVCTPDAQYMSMAATGSVEAECAVNSIVGAANYLCKLPFVDSKALGITGHSYGGWHTLDVIVRSELFAAACAGAPPSDAISFYLGANESPKAVTGRNDNLLFIETGQPRFGTTLWARPDLYIKASPIFRADKVTTPLLIMQNHGDDLVDFSQGYGMYQAMRRLQKPCWMLQYDNGRHGLTPKSKDAIDYTIRLTQFFDHYLKGAPAPIWMTKGIPARLKGIETGYELDDPNVEP